MFQRCTFLLKMNEILVFYNCNVKYFKKQHVIFVSLTLYCFCCECFAVFTIPLLPSGDKAYNKLIISVIILLCNISNIDFYIHICVICFIVSDNFCCLCTYIRSYNDEDIYSNFYNRDVCNHNSKKIIDGSE